MQAGVWPWQGAVSDEAMLVRNTPTFFDDASLLQRTLKAAAVLGIHVGILFVFLHGPHLGKAADMVSYVTIQAVDRVSYASIPNVDNSRQLRPVTPTRLQPIPPSEKPPEFDLADENLVTLPPRVDPLSVNQSPSLPAKFTGLARNIGKLIVIVHVHVLNSGEVDQGTVVGSCGVPELDDVAVRFVKDHWHFLPARKDGLPIDSWTNTEVLFRDA